MAKTVLSVFMVFLLGWTRTESADEIVPDFKLMKGERERLPAGFLVGCSKMFEAPMDCFAFIITS